MVARGAQITSSLVRVSGSDCNLNLSIGFGKRHRLGSIEEAHFGLFSARLNSPGRRTQEKSAAQSLRCIFKVGIETSITNEANEIHIHGGSGFVGRILTYHIEERD